MKKVRALCSIMHEKVWRIPGDASEIFEVTEEKYESLSRFVTLVDGGPVEEVPVAKVAKPTPEEAPKKRTSSRKRARK